MSSKVTYKSEAFESIHRAVSGMYRAGTVVDGTMLEFDDSCLAVAGSGPDQCESPPEKD